MDDRSDPRADPGLRVMSWNIWWRFGPWQDRAHVIGQVLRDSGADVIALQEVWDDGTANQARDLARDLGFHHAYAHAMQMGDTGFGVAILSRWPIRRTAETGLYNPEGSFEQRVALFAEIGGPHGTIPVFCTHLNYRYDHSHIRQKQVADLARFVAEQRGRGYPAVLCGDFNAEPDADEIRMLRGLTTCPVEDVWFHDAWLVAGDGSAGHSWDNANPHAAQEAEPDRRIDYVFVGPAGRDRAGQVLDCHLAGNAPVDGVWPSDHFAVVADLRYSRGR